MTVWNPVPWIGPLGGLKPLSMANGVELKQPDRFVVKTTIGGFPRAQRLQRLGRTWTIKGQVASGQEIAAIQALDEGLFGYGPFAFVSEQAQVQNLLTPGESWCREPTVLNRPGVTAGGGFAVSPGAPLAGAYVIDRTVQASTVPLGQLIPVVPGQPVHGSAWVSGPAGARLYLLAYDSAGVLIAPGARGGAPSTTSGPSRLTVFRDDLPTQTAWISLGVSGADQVTMPQVTWRPTISDWGPGQGCRHAIIERFETSLRHMDLRDGTTWHDYTATISEVG